MLTESTRKASGKIEGIPSRKNELLEAHQLIVVWHSEFVIDVEVFRDNLLILQVSNVLLYLQNTSFNRGFKAFLVCLIHLQVVKLIFLSLGDRIECIKILVYLSEYLCVWACCIFFILN